VRPQAGSAIVFDHRLWHDGEPVTAGTKLVMRTDVLYRRRGARVVTVASAPDAPGAWRLKELLRGHTGYVWDVAVLPDGGLATSSRDRIIRLWRKAGAGWTESERWTGHQASIAALLVQPDGTVWSGSRDETVRSWLSGSARILGRHRGAVLRLAHLPDGGVASGGADGVIRLWSPEGREMGAIEAHQGWIWGLAALGGRWLVSVSEDASAALWDVGNRKLVSRLRGEVPFRALATSARGEVALGGADGSIRRHRLVGDPDRLAFEVLARVCAHRGAVSSLSYLRNGLLASGGEDDLARVGRIDDGTTEATLPHGGLVRVVRQLPDESLVTASDDGLIRIWDRCAR